MDEELARYARLMEFIASGRGGQVEKPERDDEEVKKQKEWSDRMDHQFEKCRAASERNEQLLGKLRKTIDDSIRNRRSEKE